MTTGDPTPDVGRLRPKLVAIAYQMLGVVADAEDAVQNALVRYQQAGPATVGSPEGFLVRATVHSSIDLLRSLKRRREQYVGPWLPEPVRTDHPPAADTLAESLSMAFLVLLDRLSPVERAAFLLRDVFGYGFDEIAGLLGKREAAVRQVVCRARKRVRVGREPGRASRRSAEVMAERFVAACRAGDIAGIERLLTADVAAHSDGGGKAAAALAVVGGAGRVARFLAGVFRKRLRACEAVATAVNGGPGVAFTLHGRVVHVLAFDVTDAGVAAVYSVVNPDKLGRWNPASAG